MQEEKLSFQEKMFTTISIIYCFDHNMIADISCVIRIFKVVTDRN